MRKQTLFVSHFFHGQSLADPRNKMPVLALGIVKAE